MCLPCLYSFCKTLRTLKTTGYSPVLQQTCNLYISGLYLLPFLKQNCTQHYLQSCSFDCLTAIRIITNCAEIPVQSRTYSDTALCITASSCLGKTLLWKGPAPGILNTCSSLKHYFYNINGYLTFLPNSGLTENLSCTIYLDHILYIHVSL